MRYQAQTFIKQVQVDLLALSDADLFQTIDQWGPGKESSGLSHDALEVTWSALGYTRGPAETEHFSCPPGTKPGVEPEVQEHWLAPSPHQLRKLLTEMDVKQFAQHVIAFAFQSLHATYPEWGDGSTFNAHLANHLRWMRMNRRRNDQSTSMTPHV
jgi:hypothetical protein